MPVGAQKPKTIVLTRAKRKAKLAAAAEIVGSSAQSVPIDPPRVAAPSRPSTLAKRSKTPTLVVEQDEISEESYHSAVEEQSEDDSISEPVAPSSKRRKIKEESDMDVEPAHIVEAPAQRATRAKKAAYVSESTKRRRAIQKRAQYLKSPEAHKDIKQDQFLPLSTLWNATELKQEVEETEPAIDLESLTRPEPYLNDRDEDFRVPFVPMNLSTDALAFGDRPDGASPPPLAKPYNRVPPSSVNYRPLFANYKPPPTGGFVVNPVPAVPGGSHLSPHTPYRVPETTAPPKPGFFSSLRLNKPLVSTKPDLAPSPFIPLVAPDHFDRRNPSTVVERRHRWRDVAKGSGLVSFWSLCVVISVVLGCFLIWLSASGLLHGQPQTLEELQIVIKADAEKLWDSVYYELALQRGAYECGESEHIGLTQTEVLEHARNVFPPRFEHQHFGDIFDAFTKLVMKDTSAIKIEKAIYVVSPDLALRSLSCVVRCPFWSVLAFSPLST